VNSLNDSIIIFPSVHHTLKGEELLKEKGYQILIVPVPPFINEGCGLGIKVKEVDRDKVCAYLEEKGVTITKIVCLSES
jgi:hypothetical protein